MLSMSAKRRAFNRTRGTTLCARITAARGLVGRGRGLLGRTAIDRDEGLLFMRGRLEPFMWMHTLGMRFPIDIVFLDRHQRVLRVIHQLRPWRLSPIVWDAAYALELAAGAALHSATRPGDYVDFVD